MPRTLRLTVDQLTSFPGISTRMIRAHCHLDTTGDATTDSELDKLLNIYLLAGVAWVEQETWRSVYTRQHVLVLDRFPSSGEDGMRLRLPRGKATAVSSVQYTQNGSVLTLTGPSASPSGSDFQEDLDSDDGGILLPPYGDAWPATDLNAVAPVTITYTAGWSTATMPPQIQQAILHYVSDAVEMRGSVDLGAAGRYLADRRGMIESFDLRRPR